MKTLASKFQRHIWAKHQWLSLGDALLVYSLAVCRSKAYVDSGAPRDNVVGVSYQEISARGEKRGEREWRYVCIFVSELSFLHFLRIKSSSLFFSALSPCERVFSMALVCRYRREKKRKWWKKELLCLVSSCLSICSSPDRFHERMPRTHTPPQLLTYFTASWRRTEENLRRGKRNEWFFFPMHHSMHQKCHRPLFPFFSLAPLRNPLSYISQG